MPHDFEGKFYLMQVFLLCVDELLTRLLVFPFFLVIFLALLAAIGHRLAATALKKAGCPLFC
jgi:hypothetical protein